jgi:hypothetical protein
VEDANVPYSFWKELDHSFVLPTCTMEHMVANTLYISHSKYMMMSFHGKHHVFVWRQRIFAISADLLCVFSDGHKDDLDGPSLTYISFQDSSYSPSLFNYVYH